MPWQLSPQLDVAGSEINGAAKTHQSSSIGYILFCLNEDDKKKLFITVKASSLGVPAGSKKSCVKSPENSTAPFPEISLCGMLLSGGLLVPVKELTLP